MQNHFSTVHPPRRATILPDDRVLLYDRDQYRWHKVEDVLIGARTKIRIVGMNEFFDQGIVARHIREVRQ
jgi:hypothetical protein